jgi:hypothetical protein
MEDCNFRRVTPVAIVLPKFPRRRSSSVGSTEAQPAVNVALCREDGIYRAGGRLRATWQISRVPLEQIQGVEVSVMWHTEGKGDEDLHVHHFHRINEGQIRRTGLADQQSIQCQLPVTPLSYHGRLIRLQWCIRLRIFMTSGKEIVTEQPFYLVAGTAQDNTGIPTGNSRTSQCDPDVDNPDAVSLPSDMTTFNS